MKSPATEGFWRALERLRSRYVPRLSELFQLFQADPFHPSLHFKRIDDEDNVWAVRVGLGHRALSLREADRVTWFWIGSHSEYDKKV